MKECQEWLEEYGPAPVGWFYQIVNLNKKVRVHPEHTLVMGFDAENNYVGEIKCHQQVNGHWITPKMAKNTLRKQGAIRFTREKVWKDDTQNGTA